MLDKNRLDEATILGKRISPQAYTARGAKASQYPIVLPMPKRVFRGLDSGGRGVGRVRAMGEWYGMGCEASAMRCSESVASALFPRLLNCPPAMNPPWLFVLESRFFVSLSMNPTPIAIFKHVILSNAKDLLSHTQQIRSFAALRMTCLKHDSVQGPCAVSEETRGFP
jgi:hypothetical protein